MFQASQRRTPLSAPLKTRPTLRGDESRGVCIEGGPMSLCTERHGGAKAFLKHSARFFRTKRLKNIDYPVSLWEESGTKSIFFGNFRNA
jgi:hypothetical protein